MVFIPMFVPCGRGLINNYNDYAGEVCVVSFASDVLPKFRSQDISCMNRQRIPIADYSYMSDRTGDDVYPNCANARHVLARLSGDETPRMPLGGPYWSTTDIKTFRDWIEGGVAP